MSEEAPEQSAAPPPQGGHTLVGYNERPDADNEQTAQAWENLDTRPKEGEVPPSPEEERARLQAAEFLVNHMRRLNSERKGKDASGIRVLNAEISECHTYLEAAKAGNLFGSVSYKRIVGGEIKEEHLPSIFSYLRLISELPVANEKEEEESRQAEEAEAAIGQWVQSKLEPNLTFERAYPKVTGEVYLVVRDQEGNERHIPIEQVLGGPFNYDSSTESVSDPLDSREEDGARPEDTPEEEKTHLEQVLDGIEKYDDLDQEDEAAKEWGKFKSDGTYELLVDPAEIASKLRIEQKSIEDAAAKGIPVERLMQARENPTTAEWLRRELGSSLDWGAKLPPQVEAEASHFRGSLDMSDPMIRLNLEQGVKKTKEVQEFMDKLATSKGARELKKKLKRPGELPLYLHKIPYLGRKIGRLMLTNRIYRNEIKERKHKGWGRQPEEGMFGLGIPKKMEILEYIREHDEDVRVHNNKLRWYNRYEYRGDEGHHKSHRRDFAESLHGILQKQKALERGRIHPETIEPYEEVSKRINAYRESSKIAGLKSKAEPEIEAPEPIPVHKPGAEGAMPDPSPEDELDTQPMR